MFWTAIVAAYFVAGGVAAIVACAGRPKTFRRMAWSSLLMLLGPLPALAFALAIAARPPA